jgi:hypothetical protein
LLTSKVPAAVLKAKRPASWRWAAIAAVLLCCLAIAGVAYWRIHSPALTSQTVPTTAVAETIDLSQAGTTRRGETSTVPPVSLPRRVIAAHILLPYFSPGGKYLVSVTSDRNGSPPKAEGSGTATVNGMDADLNVTLDLRNLGPGTYYLAHDPRGRYGVVFLSADRALIWVFRDGRRPHWSRFRLNGAKLA